MFNVRAMAMKVISLFVLISFAVTTTAWSLSTPSPAEFSAEFPKSLKGIEIPEELASVEQTFESHQLSRPLVIHIQNAHSNIESQFQIRSILKYLYEKLGMRIALVEGAVNQLDPALLRFFPDPDLNLKLNEQLATKGMVSGVQLFLLEPGNQLKAYGIEDAKLYRENLANFREVMRDESTIQKFITQGTAIITNLEQKVFDQELGDLVAKRTAFRERRLDLVAYADELRRLARKHLKLDLGHADAQYEWPALTRLVVLKNLEEMNKSLFEAEYEQLEARLSQSGVPDDLKEKLGELKNHSVDRKEVRFDSTQPRFLIEQIYLKNKGQQISMAEYPQVANWLAHEILGSELDGAQLINEIERLGQMVFDNLASEPIEMELLKLIEDFNLLASALNLELTGEQFDVFTSRKIEFQMGALSQRFVALQENSGVPSSAVQKFTVGPEKINLLLDAANRFYQHARLRDDAMVQKTTEIMKRENAGVVALVTGGFHTQGVLRELKQSDISYIAITPRLKGNLNLDREHYISYLMNTKPNIFAQAHLDAIQLAQTQPLEVFRQMDPDHDETDIPETIEEFATALVSSFGEMKIPVDHLPTFQPNDLIPLTISLSPDKRLVVVNGWNREVKLPVGVGGVLDASSIRGAVAKLLEKKPAEVAKIVETPRTGEVIEKAEQIVKTQRTDEEELREIISDLSQRESLKRIDSAVLEELHQALTDIHSAKGAENRLRAINEIPTIFMKMSSGASRTLALRSLAASMSAPKIWAVLVESNFPEALGEFLGILISPPAETASAALTPETLELVGAGFGARVTIDISRVLPQTYVSRVDTIGQILSGLGAMPVQGELNETAMVDALAEREEAIVASQIRGLISSLGVEIAPVAGGVPSSLAKTFADILAGDISETNLSAATVLVEEASRIFGKPLERRFPFKGKGILDVFIYDTLTSKPVAGVELFKLGERGELVRVRKLTAGEKGLVRGETETLGVGRSMSVTPGLSIFRSLDEDNPELVVEGPAIALTHVVSGFGFQGEAPSPFVVQEETEAPETSILPKAIGADSPEILAQSKLLHEPPIVTIPEPRVELPDLSQFSREQLIAKIFEESQLPADVQPAAPEELVRTKLRVAQNLTRGIVEPSRYLWEIRKRGGIESKVESETVPVETSQTEIGSLEPTYTEGMSKTHVDALARSGGVAVIYDATRGIVPNEEEVKAYLAQLKEAAASNLKVAFIVRVSDVTQREHEALIRRVAQNLGVDSKQFKIFTETNITKFGEKLSNIPNMLASYVTDAERREHVTLVIPEALREDVRGYIPEGVQAIFHDISATTRGRDTLHYWLGAGAAIRALLSKELDDTRVRTILEPFIQQDGERANFISFVTDKALSLELRTTFLLMQRIRTSA